MKLFKSHYVSKLLLKQFSKDGLINIHEKATGISRVEELEKNDIGTILLPQIYFDAIEQRWNKNIEVKVGNILTKYSGNIRECLNDNVATGILKKFMALQFVRSKVFFMLLADKSLHEELVMIETIPKMDSDLLRFKWRNSVLSGAPKIIDDIYLKIKNDMKMFVLEIAISNRRSKFILSDVPIININKDVNGKLRLGIKQGVGYENSEMFVLPLTPSIALSLYKERRVIHLCTKDIRSLNKMSKQNSEQEFFSTPSRNK